MEFVHLLDFLDKYQLDAVWICLGIQGINSV